MRKIYVFGNDAFLFDSSAVKVAKELEIIIDNFEFVHIDPSEDFPPKKERNIIILDTVQGIKQPQLFRYSDIEQWNKSPISVHDYDLILHLGILKKTNVIDEAIIIGIPQKIKKGMIKKVESIISSI